MPLTQTGSTCACSLSSLSLLRFAPPAQPAEEEDQPEQPHQTLLAVDGASVHEATPQERIASAYRELRAALIAELLDSISEQDSEFFEKLVLDVLQAMGYGGSRRGCR